MTCNTRSLHNKSFVELWMTVIALNPSACCWETSRSVHDKLRDDHSCSLLSTKIIQLVSEYFSRLLETLYPCKISVAFRIYWRWAPTGISTLPVKSYTYLPSLRCQSRSLWEHPGRCLLSKVLYRSVRIVQDNTLCSVIIIYLENFLWEPCLHVRDHSQIT